MAEARETTALIRANPPKENIYYTQEANPGSTASKDNDSFTDEPSVRSVNRSEETLMVCPAGGIEVTPENEYTYQVPEDSLMLASDRSMQEAATSNMQTLMHLVKGNLGTGILALPVAFKNAGIWTGLFGIMIVGVVSVHCMHSLVNCSHILCKRTSSIALDYSDVIECCFKTGPQRLKKLAKPGRHLVNALLIFTQFGFCSVYIVFVATNVSQVINHFHPDGPNLRVYEVIVTALLIPYMFVRNLQTLAPFSAFANLLTFTGLIIIFQFIVQGLPNVSDRPGFSSISDLPLFFGTAIFAIEGISLVLPLENRMRHPKDFAGWLGVLNLGMVIIICLQAAIGFYGYLKFGQDVKGSITLNLPDNEWLYLSVKLMFAIAVFISYGIQFYVPIKILWPILRKKTRNKTVRNYGEYFFRTALVLVTFAFAVAIPHLELLIALIGAFASSSLALILPAVIEIITLSADGEHLPRIVLVKNLVIFIFGVLGFITGTYSSLVAIVEAF